MGYEEVETVLPADFVPRSDSPEQLQTTSTTTVKGSTTNNTKQLEEEEVVTKTKSRRSMSRGRSLKKGILNRWRRSKSRTSKKNKDKKDSNSSNTTIKKSDSNVTKKVSNSSSKTPLVTEEQRGDEVADNNTASSSSINARESPNTLDTVDTNGEQQQANAADNNNTAAVTKGGEVVVDESLSVEVEDDSGSVKSLQIDKSPSNVSTKSNKSTKSAKSTKSNKSATVDESGSVRSSRSNKSTKSTAISSKKSSSSKQVKSSKSQEDDGQAKYTSSSQENVAAAAPPEEAPSSKIKEGQEEKWVKKVSLSIGGYKTSFQFSDPTTSLANAVNDALTVVGGAVDTSTNTLEQQQADKQHLGTIGETTEGIITDEAKECDYDVNPTKLFMYLQQRAWAKALHHLQSNQNESSMWVYRKVKTTPTSSPSTDDDANVVNSSTALVVVPQEEEDAVVTPQYRWRLLPLHAAIVLGAPTEIIQAIISSHPNAARETDERGSLPVHLAASRLDVDPEGEKVVLQLFGVYPDSIDVQDRKGRTPPELAKLARSRKEIEENRKQEVKDDEEENIEGGEGGDDVSVKSSISGRFAALLKGSKSTDTADVRGRRKKKKKKGKKNTSSQPLGLTSAKSMGADDDDDDDDESVIADDASIAESLGPGFAFLKTSKPQEERERQEAQDDGKTTQEDEQTYDEIVKTAKKAIISKEYQTPEDAPQDTISPQSIPLPMSFSMGDDVSTAVASMAGSVSDALTSLAASASFSNKDEQQQQQNTKSVTISDEPPQIQTEDNSDESTIASSVDTTVTGNTKIKANEGLRALLEKAVENAGRGGMDVTKFVDLLEDEWVTDVEALRRLDGQTLDRLLPLMLSREIQRLINHADNIDNKFLKAETKRGRSMKKGKNDKKKKKRSANISSKKKKVRSITPPSESSLMTIAEDLEASPGDDQTIYSIKTERAPSRPKNGLAESEDTEAKDEPVVEDMVVEQSASLEDLEIRRLHANLIADARKKFPTREALEVCIRERQEEVERAVKVGFDVDKETLACAALADDEVRRLLPLRLILPTADDLREMIQVLQTHKEEAMRSLDMIQAANIQSEIDELQEQIDEEDRYMLKKRMGETQCESCGEMFTSEKKLKGILKVNQKSCQGCRNDNVDSRDDV